MLRSALLEAMREPRRLRSNTHKVLEPISARCQNEDNMSNVRAHQNSILQFVIDRYRCAPTFVDPVWLAMTIPQECVTETYCLHADEDVLDRVNPANARFGPRYREERMAS